MKGTSSTNRNQNNSETIDSFVTSIKQLAETCEFGDLKESLIKNHVVMGVQS